MDLSNVVLQFSDGTTQKFEGLIGLSQTFSGTGANAGKCITGIWIKSGCNQSGDGPGYGEWVENIAYNGSCESTPCNPPTITVMSNNNVTNPSYTIQAIVNNAVANHISVTVNGTQVNASFNSGNNLLTATTLLNEGNNEIVISVDECEPAQEKFIVQYTIPCNPISYNLVYPAQTNLTSSEAVVSSLNLLVNNVISSGVYVSVNGNVAPFVLTGSTLSVSNINLLNGANTVQVSLTNNCSNEVITYSIAYTAPSGPCGPRINPGNADWQFCLVTPSGTYNRNDLASNPGFTYSGAASSVYFLPIAGGGNVLLNGSPYALQNGTYYLFEGNMNITVSSNQPGAMGHWTLCLETNQAPTFGKGNNRPQSPCEAGRTPQNGVGPGRGASEVIMPPKKPAAEPVRPQGATGTVRPTNTTKPTTTTRPTTTTTTRPSGGVTTPIKEVEKVDTNSNPGGVRQPIKQPTGGPRRN